MKKKAEKGHRNQGRRGGRAKTGRETALPEGFAQMLMPIVLGVISTSRSLHQWVYQFGLETMRQLFAVEAERIAGPKNKKRKDRQANHWGEADMAFEFGGRKVMIPRPRVRSVDGKEVQLPLIEQLRETDPMTEHVVEQILLGVSTRGYGPSLGEAPDGYRTRSESKSTASRKLKEETERMMDEFLSRRLDELDLYVLMLDGITVAERAIIVALGIDGVGNKHTLGLRVGSTENAAVCTELLQDLVGRGLRCKERMLFVIDGGKGLRRAIDDVFGTAALVQRCRNHKIRNVCDHLPKHRHAYVLSTIRDAYKSKTAKTARKRLQSLISWLQNNGEDDAAASLREGLEETLTVHKLGLPYSLTRSLTTTNAIENLMSSIRHTCCNVKRWRDGSMVKRWVALSISTAEEKFRRIKGYKDMPMLVEKLNDGTALDTELAA